MSVYYGNIKALGIHYNGGNAAGIPHYQESSRTSVFTPGLVSDGYGLKDGEVPGGSEAYKAKTYPGQTGVSNAYELKTALQSATSDTIIFLENDITLDSNYTPYVGTAMSLSLPAGAVLDGCGYTINITYGVITNSERDNDQDSGGLMGVCRGTIKNLKVYNTSSYQNTNSSEINRWQAMGLLVGQLYGTVENCYITWAGTNNFFANKKSSNTNATLGGVCSQLIEGHIKNTTVDLQSTLCLETKGQGGINKNWGMYFGGFTGYCKNNNDNDQTVYCDIINCTITGTGGNFSGSGGSSIGNKENLGLLAWQSTSTSGSGYGHIGACVGWMRQGCRIHNFKIAGTFDVQVAARSRNARGLLAGGGDDYPFATDPQITGLDTIFHSSNSNNWFNRFGHSNGQWVQGHPSGAQNTRDNPYFYIYNISDDDWGFSNYDEDCIWVGKATSLGGRQLSTPTDITGAFLNNFVITTNNVDTTYNAAEVFTCPSNINKAISGILPLSTFVITPESKGETGVILNSISYGYYGYVANEQGTSAGTYKMYYNNGQTLDYTFERSPIVRIGIYEVYKLQTINNIVYHVTRNTDTGYYSE